MSYICETCKFNNHGWCEKRKFNGLKKKNIQKDECKYYSNIEIIEDKKIEENIEVQMLKIKNFGVREGFYHIQRQLLVMDDNLTVADVKQLMVNMESLFSINEKVQGIQIEGEIDQYIYEDSKKISKYWEEKYGK